MERKSGANVVNIKPTLSVVAKPEPAMVPAAPVAAVVEQTTRPANPVMTSPVVTTTKPVATTQKTDADFARTLREAGYTALEVMAALEERSLTEAKSA